MANTVPILNFTNTFGDLLAAQNRQAVELNNLAANNYTKDSGTLILNGSGTGLSVSGAALLGSGIVTGTLAVGSSISALANVFINGSGNSLEVANNSLLRGSVITNQLTANTLIRTTALNASGGIIGNDVTSNNVVRTVTLNSSGTSFVNSLQSNGAISGASATIVGTILANDLQSNTSISGSSLNLTDGAIVGGSLSVGGDFVLNGTTVYNTNTFTINANSNVGLTSTFNVNRGSSGANATIRWNETLDYWDIRDVNNPNSFSKILTANLISDSITSTSSDTMASSLAANTLNNALQANVVVLQTQITSNSISLQNQITSNVNSINASLAIIQGIDNTQNTRISSIETINSNQNTTITQVNQFANSAYNQANLAFITATSASATDATQNTRIQSLETVNINQNTAISIIQGVDITQNNNIIAVNNFAAAAYGHANNAYNYANTIFSFNTTSNVQFNSLGIGTIASNTTGEIRATNQITSFYSDDNLKTKIGNIEDALNKLVSLNGFYYKANEVAQQLGYSDKTEVGLSAQEVQKVLPEIVVPAPIDEKYLTIHYEKMIPLLVEAIKELKREVDELKKLK